MKKLSVVSAVLALGLSSVALAGGFPEVAPYAPEAAIASDAGFIFGVSGGYGMTNWKNVDKSYKVSKDNGFVGRVFAGYDFNKYVGVETGYSYFFNKAKLELGTIGSTEYKTQAIDLMLKLKAPVVDGFDLYGKIGGNYLMSNASSSGVAPSNNIKNFNVAYGFGADYYITPNIIANVEYLNFGGKAKLLDNDYQPNTNAFMVGLSYKIEL